MFPAIKFLTVFMAKILYLKRHLCKQRKSTQDACKTQLIYICKFTLKGQWLNEIFHYFTVFLFGNKNNNNKNKNKKKQKNIFQICKKKCQIMSFPICQKVFKTRNSRDDLCQGGHNTVSYWKLMNMTPSWNFNPTSYSSIY